MKFWPVALALLVATPTAALAANPTEAQTAAARTRGPCGDPWVTIALETAWGRADRTLCNIKLYNNGSWNSYDQLLGAVRATGLGKYTFRAVPITGGGPLAGRQALGVFQGATLVGAGAGNLVGAGAGNLVGAGAGNLVGAGAGNLVGAGAGNIILQVGNELVSPGGGNYTLQNGVPVRVFGQ